MTRSTRPCAADLLQQEFLAAVTADHVAATQPIFEIRAQFPREQFALKAQRDLDRIRIEAEQQVATAKASAESFRLQSQQLTPQMIQMEAIKKWNGVLPTYNGSGAIPFISLPK